LQGEAVTNRSPRNRSDRIGTVGGDQLGGDVGTGASGHEGPPSVSGW